MSATSSACRTTRWSRSAGKSRSDGYGFPPFDVHAPPEHFKFATPVPLLCVDGLERGLVVAGPDGVVVTVDVGAGVTGLIAATVGGFGGVGVWIAAPPITGAGFATPPILFCCDFAPPSVLCA